MEAARDRAERGYGPAGIVAAGVGALLLLVALTLLNWTSRIDGSAARIDAYIGATLRETRVAQGYASSSSVFAVNFALWLGWLLAAAAVGCAACACTSTRRPRGWRVAGLIVAGRGIVATVVTMLALTGLREGRDLPIRPGQHRFSEWDVGPFVAIAGFLACALACLLGTRGGVVRTTTVDRRGWIGAGCAVAAVVLGWLAFTALTWFHQDLSADDAADWNFDKLTHIALFGGQSFSDPQVGWALLTFAVTALLIATFDTPVRTLLRVVAGVAGLCGVAWTIAGVFGVYEGRADSPFDHPRIGVWAMLASFALCVAGALLRTAHPSAEPAVR